MHKGALVIITILSLVGYGALVFASPNIPGGPLSGSGGFTAGTELDPDCAPNQVVPEPCLVKPFSGWGLTGNSGIDDTVNFVGTINKADLVFKAENSEVFRAQYNGDLKLAFYPETRDDMSGIPITYTLGTTQQVTGTSFFFDGSAKTDGVFSGTYTGSSSDQYAFFIQGDKYGATRIANIGWNPQNFGSPNDVVFSGTYTGANGYLPVLATVTIGPSGTDFDWVVYDRDIQGNTTSSQTGTGTIIPGTPIALTDGIEVTFGSASYIFKEEWDTDVSVSDANPQVNDYAVWLYKNGSPEWAGGVYGMPFFIPTGTAGSYSLPLVDGLQFDFNDVSTTPKTSAMMTIQSSSPTPTNILYTDAAGVLRSTKFPTSLGGAVSVTNGLSMITGAIGLGGTLTQDTVLDGNGGSFGIGFNKLSRVDFGVSKDFTVNANNTIDLYSNDILALHAVKGITLDSQNGSIFLKTGAVNNATATNGQVLTLVDASTGQTEWQSVGGGGVSATNGLSLIGASVGLGGTLNQNTSINGDAGTYGFNFDRLFEMSIGVSNYFSIVSGDQIDIQANALSLDSTNGSFFIKTKAINTATATNGQILTLIDASTGETEWQNSGSGSSLKWYAENATAPGTAPIATGGGSIALGNGAEALGKDMFVYGLNAGKNSTSGASNFFGKEAGFNAISAGHSNFFGPGAGYNATDAYASNFFGDGTGYYATNATHSNFFGFQTGQNATNSDHSFFIGDNAGAYDFGTATGTPNANNSIFIGNNAGFNVADNALDNSGGHTSILIGDDTSTGGFSDSIAIGKGATNTATQQFMIGGGTLYDMVNPAYLSTRDDSGTFSPVNFLYTDSSGKILSAPTSLLGGGGSATVTNGLQIIGSDIGLGGTLTQNTTVGQGGKSLSFTNGNFLQNRIDNAIAPFPNEMGYINQDSPYGSSYTGASLFWTSRAGFLDPTSYHSIVNTSSQGGKLFAQGGGGTQKTQVLSGTNGIVDITASNAFLFLPTNRYAGINVNGNTGFISLSTQNTNRFTIDDSGMLTFNNYVSSRDDSGITAPGNFLYTDGAGNLLSAPTSSLAGIKWYAENGGAPGTLPSATGSRSIAIGDGAQALDSDMLVFGNGAGTALVGGGIGVNPSTEAIVLGKGAGSIHGSGSGASAEHAILIGTEAGNNNYSSEYAINIGYQSGNIGTGRGSIYIGSLSGQGPGFGGSNGDGSIGIGVSTQALGHDSIVLGTNAFTHRDNEFVIGGTGTNPYGGMPTGIDDMVITATNGSTCSIDVLGGTGLACTSDERRKTNIQDLSDTQTLENLLKIRTVSYNWKQGNISKNNIGFLAQDIEQYFPEVVITDSNGYKAVSYGNMTPMIISAIKELYLQLEDIQKVAEGMDETFITNIKNWFASATNGITLIISDTLKARNQICIDDVCMTKDQLREILQKNTSSQTVPVVSTTPVSPEVLPEGNLGDNPSQNPIVPDTSPVDTTPSTVSTDIPPQNEAPLENNL